jgi:uncharacterized integral membrane protein
MRTVRTIFWLVLVVFLLVFFLQNSQTLTMPVEIRLNLWLKDFSSPQAPLYGVVIGSFIVGLALGAVWGIVGQLRLRGRIRGMDKLLQEKERELSSLRNLPLTESPSAKGEQGP